MTKPEHPPIPVSDLDLLLTAQIGVAWAGEGGEEPRLGWWRTDLVSEFGGEDLFRRLLPDTWRWAMLQAVREAARRHDAKIRSRDHNPDRILSLFNMGFELDERVEERLQDLKRAGTPPDQALPVLHELMSGEWSRERFLEWIESHGDSDPIPAPVGRRIRGDPPADLRKRVKMLVAAFAPLSDEYPLPHFRRDR